MNNVSYGRHYSCLCALFLLGGGLLYPLRTGSFFLALISAVLLSFLVLFLSHKILFTNAKCNNIFKKILFGVIFSSTSVWGLFCFANSFKVFCRFAADLLLKTDKMTAAIVLFALVIAFLFFKGKRVMLKYALLSFLLTSAILIFCFIAFSGNFDYRNLLSFNRSNAKDFFGDICFCLSTITLPCLLLPFAAPQRRPLLKDATIGLAIGSLLLIGCSFSAVLIFGASFARILEYPFAAAVSTISLGRLFTRPDYISYYIYFVCALLRCGVYLLAVGESLKKLRNILG